MEAEAFKVMVQKKPKKSTEPSPLLFKSVIFGKQMVVRIIVYGLHAASTYTSTDPLASEDFFQMPTRVNK